MVAGRTALEVAVVAVVAGEAALQVEVAVVAKEKKSAVSLEAVVVAGELQ